MKHYLFRSIVAFTWVILVGGVFAGHVDALTTADMETAQCRAIADHADCLAAEDIDGSYTILADGKSCDVPGITAYAGKCVVKTSLFVCNGTCKKSADTAKGEHNDVGGSKVCTIKSPSTPICASTSFISGTVPPGPDTTTPTTPPTGPDTTTQTGGSSNVTSTSFQNPLKFNTVQEVLGGLLSALQGIIVILSIIFIIIGAVLYITSAGDSKRIDTAKSAITASMIGLAIGIAAPSFLKEISTILGWNASSELDSALSLTEILTNVLTFLTGIVGILAIIMLVIGALMYLTSAGDEDRIDKGKEIVKYSIIGIIISFAALVIVKQIAALFIV